MASEFLLPIDRFSGEEIGVDMEFGSIVGHEYNVGSADNEIFWDRGKRFGSGLHIVMDEGVKDLARFEVAFIVFHWEVLLCIWRVLLLHFPRMIVVSKNRLRFHILSSELKIVFLGLFVGVLGFPQLHIPLLR
ncbi:hypothetical protein AGABI1DRAFT_135124 [Agaricus bisporus var. burnettii JB137-S8]|uniref:Uncharacterized protein n=1 Tax=Agaricus bisporus var. burnettii (strain JB137-S8 / ATCC MYA-4627 / FGSC 10392) TaxID=597362 RepID=K5VG39_AGABU|nr:uncharacterized protein AGABI1DRAFT_135124 [Agaricus bisporus var. burnettii JB137-S8]EKM73294.1 hypothetical protein AGABI1DRAFT_135124 [Agaricus bisporus var. burnettii JB137-S8]